MITKVVMPQLGESVVEGTVSKWLVQEGDEIKEYDPILEVSTDKVDTEIPSPATGTVLKIYVPEGTTVERGILLAVIGQPGDPLPDPDEVVVETDGHAVAAETVPAITSTQSNGGTKQAYTGHVTPVVARMVAEHGIDLSRITGTGRGGRVTKKDVEAYLEQRDSGAVTTVADAPPWEQPVEGDLFKPTVEYDVDSPPAPAAAKPKTQPTTPQRVHPVEAIPEGTPGELVPMTKMRSAIAEHMVISKATSPHVTTVFEIDMSAVLAHRAAHKDDFAKQGVNLTLTAYFVAATVTALQQNPYLNSRWTDEGIYLQHQQHIGIAVALDDGLIVPVIHNAQDLNLLGLARTVNDLAARARNRQLKPDEVQGGTFSITNHGVSGSLFATPIINQPQVGILGVGVMEERVKVIDGAIAIRPMIYASLTFDHRVVDGATGDAFMLTLKQALEGWA
ncbi:MAG: 2-oxo acid dehydrogenase subunit E2 [Chloroflexi bacterium]|nr:MAG: 2-oxo acid dehydrogenase subunit E2 [Chloroflexota bacterium]